MIKEVFSVFRNYKRRLQEAKRNCQEVIIYGKITTKDEKELSLKVKVETE
jgi:hypothetical protein